MRDAAIQTLLDEAEIKRLHLRYCRGIDRMDWDLIRSCYHPDAIDDHGEYVGGVDGFIAYAQANLPSFTSTSHCICNQLVELRGDTAFAEHYVIAYHRFPASNGTPEKVWIVNARYVDRMERRHGEWRIAHRRSIVDAERVEVVSETLLAPEHILGRRDRSDPSYER